MKSRLLSLFFLFAFSVPHAFAQSSPVLKTASGTVVGKTASGIEYTISSNKTYPGFADFSLVFSTELENDAAAALLDGVPHLEGESVFSFFNSKGVGVREDGFVKTSAGSTVFRFENVPVAKEAVRDSVLLVLLDMASSQAAASSILIAGDVETASVASHIKLLSLMVTGRSKASSRPATPVWNPSSAVFEVLPLEGTDFSVVEISYRSPRPSREEMGTIQPYITEQFSQVLGSIFRDRMLRVCEVEDVPAAAFKTSFTGASAQSGDETLTMSFACENKDVHHLLSLAASVLGELDAHGTSVREYSEAKGEYVALLQQKALKPSDNRSVMDKFVSSVVYGTDMASPQAALEVATGRIVEPEQETKWFNDYVTALLDVDSNLSVTVRSSDRKKTNLANMQNNFKQGWTEIGRVPARRYDYLAEFVQVSPDKKFKVVSSKKEPVSGGEIWTFSNGARVIFDRRKGAKDCEITTLFNGGGNPYFADVLRLDSPEGMETEVQVGFFDTRLTIRSGVEGLEDAVKALVTYSHEHHTGRADFSFWRECADLERRASKLTDEGLYDLLDSLQVVSGYVPLKRAGWKIDDDIAIQAQRFFDEKFSAFNEAYIMISADIEPSKLKKMLVSYFPALPVKAVQPQRKSYDMLLLSSSRTANVDSFPDNYGTGKEGLYISGSCLETFSMQKYFATLLASRILEAKLAPLAARAGMSICCTSEYVLAPVERACLRVAFAPVSSQVLPSEVTPLNVYDDAASLRRLMADTADQEITPAELSAAKALVLADYSAQMEQPGAKVRYTLDRYSLNKDFYTNYKDKLSAVPSSVVSEVLRKMVSGAGADYILYY